MGYTDCAGGDARRNAHDSVRVAKDARHTASQHFRTETLYDTPRDVQSQSRLQCTD